MTEVKEGDLVRLKSGGPLMTVCHNRNEWTDAVYISDTLGVQNVVVPTGGIVVVDPEMSLKPEPATQDTGTAPTPDRSKQPDRSVVKTAGKLISVGECNDPHVRDQYWIRFEMKARVDYVESVEELRKMFMNSEWVWATLSNREE